jgi:sporulation protein YqfC
MEKKKQLMERFSVQRRQRLILPDEIFGGGPFIELCGRREICIQGCKKILLCEPDTVRLALCGAVLSVSGRGLVCTTYFAGAVSVRGVICRVEFEDGSESACC